MTPLVAWLAATALSVVAGLTALPGGEPAGPRAVLRWEARFERSVYGYLIYRGDAREGPFLRVGGIVHVRQSTDETPARYEFTDGNVQAGGTYFYYLDTVGLDGKKRRFSPVMSKTVAGASVDEAQPVPPLPG